jgi:hypothetical protein
MESAATSGRIVGRIAARTVVPNGDRATIATAVTAAAGLTATAGATIAVRSATIASTP